MQPEELPDSVGLLVVNSGATGLLTKRKATHRAIAFPEELVSYLLMSRMQVCRRWYDTDDVTAKHEKWRDWLAEKEEKRTIGYEVAKALRDRYERDVESVQKRIAELQRENERLAEVKAACKALDVRFDGWQRPEDVAKRLAEHQAAMPPELARLLRSMSGELAEAIKLVGGGT